MRLSNRSIGFLTLVLGAWISLGSGCSDQNSNDAANPDAGGHAGIDSQVDGSQSATLVDCPDCTVLLGARLFDGKTTRPGTLVLKGTTIFKVIFGEVQVDAGKTVDLSGKTVLPGLLDLHVHTPASAGPSTYMGYEDYMVPHFKAMLRSGVTSYLDLGSSARMIFAYRQRIADGVMRGPGMLAAGPLVTASGGHPCYEGSPPQDGCVLVDAVSDLGKLDSLWPQKPDVLKLVLEGGTDSWPLPRLDLDALEALTAAAQGRGVPAVTHVASAQDVADALDRGVRIFAHLPANDLMSEELVTRLVEEQAVIIPTLVIFENLYLLAQEKLALEKDKLADDVPADVLAAFDNPQYSGTSESYKVWTKALWDNAQKNLKACVEAGVLLAAGTDAGNPGTFHGLAMARELELYVAAGMTPAQAITAATSQAADTLGLDDRGALAIGLRADLLVVSGDPLTSIANIGQVTEVFLLGERLDRDALKLGGAGNLTLKRVEDQQEGQPCLADEECAEGLTCDVWSVRCTASCNLYTGSGCQAGSACMAMSETATTGFCYEGDGCDLFAQDCENNAACVWMGNTTTVCWYANPDKLAGDACDMSTSCAKGYQCNMYEGTCYELCHPTDPEQGPCSDSTQTCSDLSNYAGQPAGQCM